MLKIILIVLAVIAVGVVGLLAYAATKPDRFTVQRTASIKAPPEKIFPFINDFRQWGVWSPYEKVDPEMKRTYGLKSAGQGATYAWDGNKNVGSGSMEILDARAPQKVSIKLDFSRPFEAHNIAEFTLVPGGDATDVTWLMQGPVPYFAKIIHVFMDMDKMVGGQFAEGLANLKAAAEK
jgi:carbon monoxide dehydrogenase subunit G